MSYLLFASLTLGGVVIALAVTMLIDKYSARFDRWYSEEDENPTTIHGQEFD